MRNLAGIKTIDLGQKCKWIIYLQLWSAMGLADLL